MPGVNDHDVVLDREVIEKPIEHPDRLEVPLEPGRSPRLVVNEQVLAHGDPADDAPARRPVCPQRPGLEAVIVVLVHGLRVPHDVVLEDARVTEPAHSIAGEVLDQVPRSPATIGEQLDREVDVEDVVVREGGVRRRGEHRVEREAIPIGLAPRRHIKRAEHLTPAHLDVLTGAVPRVVFDEHDRPSGRRAPTMSRADRYPIDDPMRRRAKVDALERRGVPLLRLDRDRGAVMKPLDKERAVVAAAQPDRVPGADDPADVRRDDPDTSLPGERRPLLTSHLPRVEDPLQRSPRRTGRAIIRVRSVHRIHVKIRRPRAPRP